MVNPIAPAGIPVAGDATTVAISRPPTNPEPARRATPVQETISGSSFPATGGRQPDGLVQHPLDKTLEYLNENMKAWSTDMRFDIDPVSERLVVSIIDNQSGEVLRTVPSETVIRIAKMIAQLQGNHVNTKV